MLFFGGAIFSLFCGCLFSFLCVVCCEVFRSCLCLDLGWFFVPCFFCCGLGCLCGSFCGFCRCLVVLCCVCMGFVLFLSSFLLLVCVFCFLEWIFFAGIVYLEWFLLYRCLGLGGMFGLVFSAVAVGVVWYFLFLLDVWWFNL